MAKLFEPRQEAPLWLVDAIQNDPATFRKALTQDPTLVQRHYFGVMAGYYIVELTFCAMLGKHAAQALELLLEYGLPEWQTPLRYEGLMSGMVSSTHDSGLHTPEARPFIQRVARQCSTESRDRMLLLALDLKRSSVAHALVRAGANIPSQTNVSELHAQLIEYAKHLAQQRTALVVYMGMRRYRRGSYAHGRKLAALPLELVTLIARMAWAQVDTEQETCQGDAKRSVLH